MGSRLKNWLFKAVNSSGAVSPLTRAKASKAPVSMPFRAEGQRILRTTKEKCAPSATPASRRVDGCSRSTSSVVRVITGIASSDSATAPAKAEKLWKGATRIS